MYSYLPLAAGVSPADAPTWALLAARHEVEDALEGLDGAILALRALAAASTWRSRGVAALHQLLADLADEVLAQRTRLRQQLWELERRI